MSSTPIRSIALASAGAHAADQLALAALPLSAVLLLAAGPATVGTLVALQSLAWLLVSLPAGILVDALSKRTILIASQSIMVAILTAVAIAAVAGSIAGLGLATFLAASGTVVFVLATQSWLPGLVPRGDLARANATVEFARAIVTLAAPALVGFLAQAGSPNLGYALAACSAALAAGTAARLPGQATVIDAAQRLPILTAIGEGARFVAGHPYLRAIVLCAVFWNFAFFALTAVFVPLALDRLGFDARTTGLAQSAYGIGLVAGALGAPVLLSRLSPNLVLLGGPAVSVVAALLVWLAPRGAGFAGMATAEFLIGFGPMCWLICQTSLRQLVTPAGLLGRVGATIQVAIYGVRPLGALAGGLVASSFGLDAAVGLVFAGFALSFAAIATSALARLRAMPEPVVA
ncbi:MFS transporter [Chelatococcus sp. SYSU_G07232]|uniref:MFS transporter n=1 Tax=Chelatococcus albus TaxID=3047466 RepID=A0ABT7AC58_9HYPH|nr:MFS transporter [Chelatococcus sp. SYSU_G07232]MDJ1156951.1 MFS transporter [Chelatococcus sp. SYSU_G07232]